MCVCVCVLTPYPAANIDVCIYYLYIIEAAPPRISSFCMCALMLFLYEPSVHAVQTKRLNYRVNPKP